MCQEDTSPPGAVDKQKQKRRMGAVRAAVKSQIVSFKLEMLERAPVCQFSGVPVTAETATVHHDPEISTMFDDFCRLTGREPLGLDHLHDAQGIPYLTDEVLVDEWRAYHAKHAKLYLLDRAAHARHHGEPEPGSSAQKIKEAGVAWLEKLRTDKLIAMYGPKEEVS